MRGGELVFVDQSAEQVTAADAIEIDHVGHRALITGWRPVERWPLGECAVRPVLVVVERVGREDVLEVAAADDQEPIEALTADVSDPALGCARAWGARIGALITRMPSA